MRDKQWRGLYVDGIGRYIVVVVAALTAGAGIMEAIWGVLQLTGIVNPGHRLYIVTGSFFNPGPYGCFLGMTVPISLWMAMRCDGWLKYIGMSAFLLCSSLLPASMSRTGWAAAIAGSLLTYCLMCRECLHKLWKESHLTKNIVGRWSLTVGIILFFAVMIYIVYQIKPESALGRFLIWKISLRALLSSPTGGVGWNHVAGAYGEAQEEYFSTKDGDITYEGMLAGAPEYLFNDYLQIGLAFGWWAMAAFVCLIVFCLFTAIKSHLYGYSGAVLAFAVVSFASYPLQFNIFIACASMLVIGCAAGRWTDWKWLRCISFVVVAVTLTICCVLASDVRYPAVTDANLLFRRGHDLHIAGHYEESDSLMMEVLKISSDPMPLNILGKNCQARDDYAGAEKYFLRASHRNPSAIYPRYLLMMLYVDSGDTAKVRSAASYILRMPTKVDSPAERDMRKKASELMRLSSNLK